MLKLAGPDSPAYWDIYRELPLPKACH
jgi:hypothetical protein